MEDKLTAQQAANALGYHINYLYRLLKEGRVKGTRWGREWIIDRVEIERIRSLQDEHGKLPKGQV
jgi:excisionase family DNA binding protein